MMFLVAYAATSLAQITRGQADTVVKEYLQREVVASSSLYVHVNAPDAEGILLTTSNDETFKATYACWAYYLNESELSQCRYLFVKSDNGNLLEVIASNDLGQSDLTKWKAVDDVGVVETGHAPSPPRIYPNPVDDVLTIPYTGNYMRIEIHDLKGNSLFSGLLSDKETSQLNVSFLNTGIYMLSVYSETSVVYKLIKF